MEILVIYSIGFIGLLIYLTAIDAAGGIGLDDTGQNIMGAIFWPVMVVVLVGFLIGEGIKMGKGK